MNVINNSASAAAPPAPWLGRLLVISLLVMLNIPAVLTGVTGMDQYGFFTLEPVAARPWPLVLSIALSTLSAGAGYLAFRLLQLRVWFSGNRYEAYHRNAVLFGVPVAIAFLPSFFLTCYDSKPVVLGVAGIMATSLCITAALSDPQTLIDQGTARILFVVGAAIILLLIILSVSGMLMMYFVEHSPSSGNFFWTWEFAWSDLGYPAEEYSRRHRSGLLAFGVAGICYMTVALGGSMLGAALRWAKPAEEAGEKPAEEANPAEEKLAPVEEARPVEEKPVPVVEEARPAEEREYGHTAVEAALPHPVELSLDWLNAGGEASQESPVFVMVLNGEETLINLIQYESLLAGKDTLLPDTELLVDKASGTAFARNGVKFNKISFRGRRKGPFSLLCIYARYPGRRFTTGELEVLLQAELPDREQVNASNVIAQLQKRAPLVTVMRDRDGSYLPETVNVCFLDHYAEPPADSAEHFAEPPLS